MVWGCWHPPDNGVAELSMLFGARVLWGSVCESSMQHQAPVSSVDQKGWQDSRSLIGISLFVTFLFQCNFFLLPLNRRIFNQQHFLC